METPSAAGARDNTSPDTNGAALVLDDSGPKTRTVGTLTYTSAGLAAIFCWLLWGDFALAMRDRSIPPVVQLFLKRLHTSDTSMAVLMTVVPQLIGMVLGPVLSYKSDRHRGRWGRRIPFLLIPTPIAALAMLGLAFVPQIGLAIHAAAGSAAPSVERTQFLLFGLFWMAFEIAAIAATTVFSGLINDVVPRAVMGRFYGLFRAVSLAAGMIFNFFIIAHAETHFTEIFIGMGLLFGVGFTLMCVKVKEGAYPLPVANSNDHRAGGFFPAVKVYFRECFNHPHYLMTFLMFAVAGLAPVPVNMYLVLFRDTVQMRLQTYGTLVTISYAISLVLAYPLGWLVDRYHPLRMSVISMTLYAATLLWGSVFIHDTYTFGAALIAHTVLSGTYFTSAASLGQVLYPREKFAQFASAGGLVHSLAQIVMAPLFGLMLDFSGHNYRQTFMMGFVLSVIAIGLLLWTFHRFTKLGGQAGYVAPTVGSQR